MVQKSRSGISFGRIRNNFPDFSILKFMLPLGFVRLKVRNRAMVYKKFAKSPKNNRNLNLDAIALRQLEKIIIHRAASHLCTMNIFVGLSQYLQIGMPINFCRAKMSTPSQPDQAEPCGLQNIERPALDASGGGWSRSRSRTNSQPEKACKTRRVPLVR